MGFLSGVFDVAKDIFDPFDIGSGLVSDLKDGIKSVTGAKELERSARAAEQANERAARIERVQAQRQRVQAIRQARIQVAQAQQLGANAGIAGQGFASSGLSGAIGGFQTQFASNLNFTDQLNTLSMQRMNFINEAERLRERGIKKQQQFGQILQIGGQLASMFATPGGAPGGGGVPKGATPGFGG